MAKKKFYAVRNGKKTGIFETWEECQQYVLGFKGAEYKSFSELADAEKYLKNDMSAVDDPSKQKNNQADINEIISEYGSNLDDVSAVAFTDGSFDKDENRYSYGCIYITDKEYKTFSGIGSDERFLKSRNIAGELLGVLFIIDYAIKDGKKKITVYHDYIGISAFADGSFAANTEISQYYRSCIQTYDQLIDISFKKVEGHTGVPLNELADKLAKKELNI